ncbi:MAG: DUF2851 family protein [Saprospiraceae bacterium]|nr:DUF2851 family protein [Saprospiraceae bacterium]
MMILREDLLYFIWLTRRFRLDHMYTTAGEALEILSFGARNMSSGPDFLHGLVRIQDVLWAGNIEMHVLASDWEKHRHSQDQAFQNVVLHVVWQDDVGVQGSHIPVLELKGRVDHHMLTLYADLMGSTRWLPCEPLLNTEAVTRFTLSAFALVTDRFETRVHKLKVTDEVKQMDWEQAMSKQLCRYLLGRENAECGEMLAERLPVTIVERNGNSLFTMECLVFGVAGFLEDIVDDDYHHAMCSEFKFLKSKYGIRPMAKVNWRHFGMHAAGLPAIRLAQLAALLSKGSRYLDAAKNAASVSDLYVLMEAGTSSYWCDHHDFGKKSARSRQKKVTTELKDRLIINAILPVLYTYAHITGQEALRIKCLDFLTDLKVEKSAVVTKMLERGFRADHALDTQALLELKKGYCDQKRCLMCPIGSYLFGGTK